ncbi:MAG: hypothetical protein N2688_09580 [Burkholderiaceae bacterium]|nr:hypothetical protein [Burkholderiaceae bacterium]
MKPVRRVPRAAELGLTAREYALLRRLRTPQRIQAFLNALPINHELDGETVRSVRGVLKHRRAHCVEGAFVAACALWINGEPPLVMHLDCDISDHPHVVAVFRRGRCWGAISKTNGVALRYRDPVYRSLRELAMSYFHEYADKHGRRTLRSYSGAFDLRRIDPKLWVSNGDDCWVVHDRLAALRHYPLIDGRQARALSRRDPFEQRIAGLVQYPKPPRRRRASARRAGR